MNRLLTNYLRNGTIGIYVCFTFSDIQVTKKHCVFKYHFLKISKLVKIFIHLKKIVAIYNVFKVFLNTKRSLHVHQM